MGHHKNRVIGRFPCRPLCKRRGYIPEPCEVITNPNDVVYHVNYLHESKHCNRHGPNRSLKFSHTSCITAIRNYVERMQGCKHKKRRSGSKPPKDNAEKIICSLKNDIQMISKYEEEAACNPDKTPSSDPFFILSAMMCKINKLECILLSHSDCKDQGEKRKEMLATARCIKKSLLDQAQCDEVLLQEKQKKLACIIRDLEKFEKDICCSSRKEKKACSSDSNTGKSCSCKDRTKCAPTCSGREGCRSRSPCADPCKDAGPSKDLCNDPCKDRCSDPRKNYDITGLKVTYMKSHVQKDNCGGENECVKDKVCCEVNEDENCQVTVQRGGAATCSNDCNPVIKQRMTDLSKIWMESARQLIDACSSY